MDSSISVINTAPSRLKSWEVSATQRVKEFNRVVSTTSGHVQLCQRHSSWRGVQPYDRPCVRLTPPEIRSYSTSVFSQAHFQWGHRDLAPPVIVISATRPTLPPCTLTVDSFEIETFNSTGWVPFSNANGRLPAGLSVIGQNDRINVLQLKRSLVEHKSSESPKRELLRAQWPCV